MYLHAFIVFLFGAAIGSFLNVVIFRYNSGESALKGHSRCFSCGKKLSWYELIPIFSFLVQRGKCHGCGSKISLQYPAVEILTGLLFALIYLKFFNNPLLITYYLLLITLLIVIAVYDLKHFIIPNKTVWLFNALAFVFLFFNVSSFKFQVLGLLSGLSFFAFFALLWLVSRGRWMGFGDAKLALGMGWVLGPAKTVVAFMFSFWIGAIIGIILLIFQKSKYGLKSQIPFGPFLVIGFLIALFIDFNLLDCLILTF